MLLKVHLKENTIALIWLMYIRVSMHADIRQR